MRPTSMGCQPSHAYRGSANGFLGLSTNHANVSDFTPEDSVAMHHFCRIRSVLVGAIPIVMLSACAFAPGMHFDPDTPVDPADPTSLPTITSITPGLVRQQKLARQSASDSVSRDLLGHPQHYLIGPADMLSIIVWDHPELVVPNLTYTIGDTAGTLPTGPGLSSHAIPGFVVGDDGNIQFPYVGHIKASGKTTSEVQAALKQ